MTYDLKPAFLEIEDDLLLVESSASVLRVVYDHLEGNKGGAAAESVWLAAKTIEDACWRIRGTLGDRRSSADLPCATGKEASP